MATGSFAMPAKEPAPSFGTEEQAGPNGSFVFIEPSASTGDDASAELALEPGELSFESLEQAARVSGRATAADRATAARRT
ncbi:hypothetical protein GCM10010207_22090 [Streptomyces atratus]|nr:hypothetical protein GCM10010207_22090 [Streptomyces atratus]